MGVFTFRVGSVRCSRVGYVDVEVDADAVGLAAEQVAAVPWAEPAWASNGQVRVGAAAWIIESGDARIVVDPAQAADALLRDDDAAAHQEAFASALADAGFARDTITHAVASHLDGIGMFAWRNEAGSWAPFFPNAAIHMSAQELAGLDSEYGAGGGEPVSGLDVLNELRAQGAVDANDDGERITDAVTLEHTGAHSPGHQVVRIESSGDSAVMLGHLAISPLTLAMGENRLNLEPSAAFAALEAIRDEGSILIGPLWPEPGAGRWHDGALVPLTAV